jgi:plastocyanin
MNHKLALSLVLLLLLAACTPKSAPAAGPSQPSGASAASAPLSGNAEVKIAGFAFDPSSVTVKTGATVTWTNQDSAKHTVVADDNSFTSGDLNQGDSFSFTFSQSGTFSYHCGVHTNMKGTIIVVP